MIQLQQSRAVDEPRRHMRINVSKNSKSYNYEYTVSLDWSDASADMNGATMWLEDMAATAYRLIQSSIEYQRTNDREA